MKLLKITAIDIHVVTAMSSIITASNFAPVVEIDLVRSGRGYRSQETGK